MIKLIGISGKICSGKTTITEALIEHYGYKRVVLAEPLKAIGKWFIEYSQNHNLPEDKLIEILFEIMNDESETTLSIAWKAFKAKNILFEKVFTQFEDADWSIEKNNDIRLLYQLIGEVFRQNFGDDIWVKAMLNRVKHDQSIHNVKCFICDDVRQKSEYNMMKDFGFKIVRLVVDKDTQMQRVNNLYGNIDPQRFNHISEIDLDDINDFDLIVDNSAPLDDVFSEIIEFIEAN